MGQETRTANPEGNIDYHNHDNHSNDVRLAFPDRDPVQLSACHRTICKPGDIARPDAV